MNLPITEARLSVGACNSDRIFLTEMAAVPSSVPVHREFAEGEEFRGEVRVNDSFRVCRAALKPTNVQWFANASEHVLGILVSR
jgi:hypothetical protein